MASWSPKAGVVTFPGLSTPHTLGSTGANGTAEPPTAPRISIRPQRGACSSSLLRASTSARRPSGALERARSRSTAEDPEGGRKAALAVSSSPYVDLKCYQNGGLVGEGWAAFFAGGTAGTFGLYGGQWTSGAADCRADLGMYENHGKWKVLASTNFHVGA